MSAVIAKFEKYPGEVQDYDISFSEYLSSINDTGQTHEVEADSGITINSSALASGVVKVWVSGGTKGSKYTIVCKLTTAGGRVKHGVFELKII